MSQNRRMTDATPGKERLNSGNGVAVSKNPARTSKSSQNSSASAQSSNTNPTDTEVMSTLWNRHVEEFSNRDHTREAAQEYVRNAPEDNEMAVKIRQADVEEAQVLEEIRNLREENWTQEMEFMTVYRGTALKNAAVIRDSKQQEHLLAHGFDSAAKKDLKAQSQKLTNLRKKTEAALHILTRLPLLLADYPSTEVKTESSNLIHGLTEFDEDTVRPLIAEFQSLRY